MIEPGWIMDSECCCQCGALLDYFETYLCFDCEEDELWKEQHQYDDPWWEHTCSEGDEQPTIGTPEEAHAVALSLSDAEVERLWKDEKSKGKHCVFIWRGNTVLA